MTTAGTATHSTAATRARHDSRRVAILITPTDWACLPPLSGADHVTKLHDYVRDAAPDGLKLKFVHTPGI